MKGYFKTYYDIIKMFDLDIWPTDLEVAFISVAAVCRRAEPRSRIWNTSDLFRTTTSSRPCIITDPCRNTKQTLYDVYGQKCGFLNELNIKSTIWLENE